MEATQIWILTSVAATLFGICAFGLKTAVGLVLKRLDKIAELLQDLQLSRATHTQDIRELQENQKDHEERLRKIEYVHINEKL